MACALMPQITAQRGRERERSFFKETDDKIAALTALRLASLALRFLIAGRETDSRLLCSADTPAIKAERERKEERLQEYK